MVDVRFVRRLPNPPTLALVKHLAGCSELPACVKYIDESGLAAIKAMQLVNRGRLSEWRFVTIPKGPDTHARAIGTWHQHGIVHTKDTY